MVYHKVYNKPYVFEGVTPPKPEYLFMLLKGNIQKHNKYLGFLRVPPLKPELCDNLLLPKAIKINTLSLLLPPQSSSLLPGAAKRMQFPFPQNFHLF